MTLKHLFNAAIFATFVAALPANARTTYLSFGGGYNPGGSQVVLEKNMELFTASSQALATDENKSYRLFAGGCDESILDVYQTTEITPDDKIFGTFFDADTDRDCRWRHNRLTALDGASTKGDVNAILAQMSTEVKAKDHVRIYYTGHGGAGGEGETEYQENVLHMWGQEADMTVQEFTQALDELPATAHTQVVMVQCYSGGFYQMVYQGGVHGGPLSSANRCGFFSQVPTRVAAGCTPDIDKREEYSPYFWAALTGKNEKAEGVQADYNGDGQVTPNEAHAYVIIHEHSIDVPVTTSSQLMRDLGFDISKADRGASYEVLTATMDASERAIVEQIATSLKLDLASSKRPLLLLGEELAKVRKYSIFATANQKEMQKYVNLFWRDIAFYLKERFAIFYAGYGPTHGEKLVLNADLAEKAKQTFMGHRRYKDLVNAVVARDAALAVSEKWEREQARIERLVYLFETKIFESKFASANEAQAKFVKKIEELKACEAQKFFN